MLKPIDMQQVIIQLDHTEKVQQVQHPHPDRQQKYIDMQLREERRLQKSKVKDAEETGKTIIKDEKKDQGRDDRAGEGHQKNLPRLATAEESDASEHGRLIDIKV